MSNTLVDVLLATWNGARYLPDLLDSLLAQTYPHFRVLVSDDGSTDGTQAILERYRLQFGGRLMLLRPRTRADGGLRNFEYLMQASLDDGRANWSMFCDQDDVWLPHKVGNSLAEMRRIEGRSGARTPCLVHTDLSVVDQNLELIAPSFVRYQSMSPANCAALWLLSMNQVTGCATMVNRSLLEIALPIPAEVVVHDWWCAVISGSGQRSFIDSPSLLYRQHAVNQIGARSRSWPSRAARLLKDGAGVLRQAREAGCNSYRQAHALEARLRMLQRDASYVTEYLAWRNRPLWQRIRSYRKYYPGSEVDRLLRCMLWPGAEGYPAQQDSVALDVRKTEQG
ncbi:glycosyltransferase family 2 protein [Simplicispira lacusdiani]|uniref:glycosyltransferase family 2 protein n=1 Tax=Simplicispira lacusdiani TaxID=2213010 RepID=UPI000E75E52F|nr:glycosyltransferase family 2 protein [Simplicispira lacusdiani]